MSDTIVTEQTLIELFRNGTTVELNDAIARLTARVGKHQSERVYGRALRAWDRETEQQDAGADVALSVATSDVYVWEFGTLDGKTVHTADEYPNLDAAKKAIAACFSDYQYEEVERRGIRGTSVLVNRYGRYEDTGHWVYRKPQIPADVPLSDANLAAMEFRADNSCACDDDECRAGLDQVRHEDVPRLIAEIRRMRAERTHEAFFPGVPGSSWRDADGDLWMLCDDGQFRLRESGPGVDPGEIARVYGPMSPAGGA